MLVDTIIVPIYKKSRRFDPLYYRPRSLTFVPCKFFERLIVKHISDYPESTNLISPHQVGLRSGHSITETLLLSYNALTKAIIDEGIIFDMILFNFSKVFDTVTHILLQKLLSLGVSSQTLDWINVFLTNRQMRVKIRNSLSSPTGLQRKSPRIRARPLTFYNFFLCSVSCKYKIFADVIKLYLAFDSLFPTSEDFRELPADVNQLIKTSAAC